MKLVDQLSGLCGLCTMVSVNIDSSSATSELRYISTQALKFENLFIESGEIL